MPEPRGSLAPIPDVPVRARGVYVADFLTRRGDYLLFGIDRRGRCVVRRIVRDPTAWDVSVAAAWQALDECDPHPQLRVV